MGSLTRHAQIGKRRTLVALIVMLGMLCISVPVATSQTTHQDPALLAQYPDAYPMHLRNLPQGAFDDWGSLARECTSYAAWRIRSRGPNSNAAWEQGTTWQWNQLAPFQERMAMVGGRIDQTPAVGSILWWPVGSPLYVIMYGQVEHHGVRETSHVSYVEEVLPNDRAIVSEYNAGSPWGMYGVREVVTTGAYVLHFPAEHELPPADSYPAPPGHPVPVAPPTAPPTDGSTPPKRTAPKDDAPVRRSPSGPVRLTVQQMVVNQRVAQEAIRRVSSLKAKLAGVPDPATPTADNSGTAGKSGATGRNGTAGRKPALTLAQLRTNHRIGIHALTVVRELETVVNGKPGPVGLSRAQAPRKLTVTAVRTDQRIAQEALRRTDALAKAIAARQ